MSLITDSDDYTPENVDGTYVDKMPSFANRPQGFRCPCSNKCYTTRVLLASHIKTVMHKTWIESLNANRVNHYVELEKERQIVHQQKIIIAQMEREIARLEYEKRNLLKTIHIISSVNPSSQSPDKEIDLIDFDREDLLQ